MIGPCEADPTERIAAGGSVAAAARDMGKGGARVRMPIRMLEADQDAEGDAWPAALRSGNT